MCGAAVQVLPLPLNSQPQERSALIDSMLAWAFDTFHGGIEQPEVHFKPAQLGITRR